jgi:hypothetical protein
MFSRGSVLARAQTVLRVALVAVAAQEVFHGISGI